MHILTTSEPDAYAGRVSPISTTGVGRGEWGILALHTYHDTPSHARPTHRSVPPTLRPPTTLSHPLLIRPPTSPSLSPLRNDASGAIYGKLTSDSMQKVEDAMISHCGLGKGSVFIDVGAGLGKPSIQVAQYPGMATSYGIESEELTVLSSITTNLMLFVIIDAHNESYYL